MSFAGVLPAALKINTAERLRTTPDKFVRDSKVMRSPRATDSMTIGVMSAASMTPGD